MNISLVISVPAIWVPGLGLQKKEIVFIGPKKEYCSTSKTSIIYKFRSDVWSTWKNKGLFSIEWILVSLFYHQSLLLSWKMQSFLFVVNLRTVISPFFYGLPIFSPGAFSSDIFSCKGLTHNLHIVLFRGIVSHNHDLTRWRDWCKFVLTSWFNRYPLKTR